MGKTLLGKIIYFWIFVMGFMFMGNMMGFMETTKDFIALVAVAFFIYWGFAFIKYHLDKKKEASDAEAAVRSAGKDNIRRKR